MARTIVIVARGNVAVYQYLKQAFKHEEDIEIVFDRRREQQQPKRDDLGTAMKSIFSRGAPPSPAVRKEERRQRAMVDEQIRTQGWAVVHHEGKDLRRDKAMAEQYMKMRAVWSAPRAPEPDPVQAVLVEHSGVCFDCLAERAQLSVNEVMVVVRRHQRDVFLAFATRACALCLRKSLVAYMRHRLTAHARHTPAAWAEAETAREVHATEPTLT